MEALILVWPLVYILAHWLPPRWTDRMASRWLR